MLFMPRKAAWFLPRAQRGGHDSDSRYDEAASLYMPHSVVVLPSESAPHASDAGERL